ncbi:hypothetical protein RB195_026263 [Necator americanus]|uniref:TMC domain-containing protein n=1 Tax=Necator americanus TaxID=51031 RepID=A0ABR1EWN7_NECAM
MGGRGAGGSGIVSHLGYAVTPTLAPAVASMPIAGRRGSSLRQSDKNTPDRPPLDSSKQESLDDRASSKLTLDDELFDILYAFGESDAFLGKADHRDDADEDGKPLTRQALLERIRQKKEVIGKLRCQPWSMTRKKRTLKLAQKYLEQHESRVSRTHLYMEELRKRMRLLKRSFSNIKTYLIPWEGKIKRIESHFGSVVSSYFTFLRWIVFVNVIITLIILALVVLPEALADAAADESRRNRTESRKEIPSNERIHADEIAVVWHYDGYLRYSPLFYGYYSDDEFLWQKYPLPLAYFLVTIFIFAYSFFAILRKMAANARMSKLSGSKAEQYIFNWRVFTGWDYTIGNQDTASNTVMAIVIKLRESIADCRVSIGSKFRCLQFTLRVIANLVICGMLAFSIYCISFAVQKSQTAVEQEGNLFTKNQVPSVVATITHVFPMIFDLIGRLENYHPRTALRAHLTRVLVLYVLNYLTLIVALFDKMDAIRRKEPVDTLMYRKKRQLGGRNPNLPRPPPYASRTFENRTDLLRFIAKSTQRFGQTRTTREVLTTPFTVAPQFGPVNVNNPNAILRNGTLRKIFEAKRIGPDPLPIYTPPPRTHPPYEPGNVKESFGGPDFSTTSSPRTYTRTTKQPIRITKPATTKKVTVANTVSGKTETTKATSSSNAAPNDNLSDSEDPARNFLQANETMRLPAAAERRSSADEVYNTDICWETIIGQEIVKLVTMDLIVTIVSILVIDFLRGLWINVDSLFLSFTMSPFQPEYGEFKVAENVLHIINNQGMIWLGLFFAPLLPALNNIKLVVIMYIRGWAVMTCNVPAREIFRASRSSNFYLLILLLWLLLCTLPVGFVIASTKPSRKCGPFAQHDHFYTVITNEIEKRVDPFLLGYIRHVASPGVVIPILLFLMLIIYFLVSLVRGLREANTDLQQQLIHERTEEKKKIFELAGGKKKIDPDRDRDHKKAMQYLPLIEQQRREPWRAYIEPSEEPLRADDSSESEEEDQDEAPSPTYPHRLTAPVPSSTSETVAAMHFHPSLDSLDEREEAEEEASQTMENPQRIVHSVSQQFSVNAQTESPTESFEVQSNVIDIATPEEVRSLLRPFLEMKVLSQRRARGFPHDLNSPPPGIRDRDPSSVDDTSSAAPATTVVLSSRRSSKRHSYISLYEYASGSGCGSGATRDEISYFGAPTLITSQRLRNSQEMRAEVHRLPTTRESEEEPSAMKQSTESSEQCMKTNGNGNKFAVEGSHSTFQPWPSIDEVRARREQLLKKTPLPFYKTSINEYPTSPQLYQPGPSTKPVDNIQKPSVPVHRKYEQEVSSTVSSTDDERRSASPSRRFRISVSPSRRIDTDNVGSGKARRFTIKQESAAPSMTSIRRVTPSDDGQSTNGKAPCVKFGDDDSPRVLEG